MTRRIFTPQDKEQIWSLWRAGTSISDIARATQRKPGTIHTFLSDRGGIQPRSSSPSSHRLSASERETISRGLAAKHSFRAIARELGRAPSTVSREVNRNGGRVRYRALGAQRAAQKARKRPKPLLLERKDKRRALVESKLALDWSPQQIAGWLRRHKSASPELLISHEAIYRALYLRQRTGLAKDLLRRLRSRRKMRRSRKASTAGQRRGQIVDAVPISARPSEIESRSELGHWEGDLIAGRANSHVATLVERKSRFTMLVKVNGKDAQTVTQALKEAISRLTEIPFRTLTWDRGTELARHKELSAATNTDIYFCDPKSPWQRGTNENTNRLLRQYLPKDTRLGERTQDDLDKIAAQLNQRPRKILAFRTPVDVMGGVLR